MPGYRKRRWAPSSEEPGIIYSLFGNREISGPPFASRARGRVVKAESS